MVSPIYIIAVLLGSAFLLGVFKKKDQGFVGILSLLALAFAVFVSAGWLLLLSSGQEVTQNILTGGSTPPFSINLRMGLEESLFTLFINVLGLLGFTYLYRDFREQGTKGSMLFLVLVMAMNVLVMSRDIFNLFVFLEVVSIATAGLLYLKKEHTSYAAGFKYLIAVGVISSFLLIGIGFFYLHTGTLNIDTFVNSHPVAFKGISLAMFMILMAILLELKPFPANGWALDIYQAAHPGISAMISSGTATASIFVLYKLLPMSQISWLPYLMVIGAITFVGSNILGIAQQNSNRLLGYSSIGQIGLMLVILGLAPKLGEHFNFVFLSIFISHFLAKAGLFWISGMVKKEAITQWSVIRKSRLLIFMFGLFLLTLLGFPPFPSFYGKWQLIMELSHQHMFIWIAVILAGSFFEGLYLFRWFGYAMKGEQEMESKIEIRWEKILPPLVFTIFVLAVSYYVNSMSELGGTLNLVPLLFIILLFMIDFLPAWIKNTLVIAGMVVYSAWLYPSIEGDMLRLIFSGIFMIGGILTLFAGYSVKGKREGFFPFAVMMYAGLIGLVEAENLFQFFFAWELMTLGSYILILRGKRSIKHALNYMLFSLGGAYLILAGIALSHFGTHSLDLSILSGSNFPGWSYTLLAIGFLTKTAALGLHIWLPGAHAEAESDVSPMVSGILLKGGVFGLILLFLYMGAEQSDQYSFLYILGWLGAITALGGNLMAVFQEDAKRLLAYSSVGNLGYILFALAFMTNVGWLTALTYSINHFMFKTLLFLAIGGVVMRVKTHKMYEMGGLIKQMPWSFIAVLIGIITLAGIPPLAGFAGKWLFYNAVLAKGWYFQGALVFFSGTIAFLYAFKLIHSVFLGQPKDNFRKVKEVPMWYIIPQVILIIGILIFSARPDLVLKPIGSMLAQSSYFPSDPLTWENVTATTNLGTWSGWKIMVVIMVMFVILASWLWIMSRKAQKVKQFNIVYAGERPFKPETTHFSHNMFSHYFRAVGFLTIPVVTEFWNGVHAISHQVADNTRRIYSGNGQTYVVHILLYMVVIYMLMFSL
ncbi:MAG: proton-conducting transporter membrane subunit [Bacteroidota bacterium]